MLAGMSEAERAALLEGLSAAELAAVCANMSDKAKAAALAGLGAAAQVKRSLAGHFSRALFAEAGLFCLLARLLLLWRGFFCC